MMRQKFTVGAVALAFALGAAPAVAQENPRTGGPGSRSSSGGERTGTPVPRGGGSGESRGGGATSGGGMSGGSVGSSSSPSTPSSSRVGSPAPERFVSPAVERAPRRSDGQATRTRSGGEATGRRAVPRSGGGAVEGGSTTRTAPPMGSSSSVDRANAPERRAVRVSNRPRDERPVTGVAVPRGSVTPAPGRDIIYVYRPYYNPWGFYGPGLGYGLGYLYYDPWWYGGYGSYYGGGYYGGGYYGGSGGYQASYGDAGALRLKLKPREAQVFVDGYFVGVVDSFDGIFQKLQLDSGGHQIEVKAEGYEPLQFEVLIPPGETVTYKGEMIPVR